MGISGRAHARNRAAGAGCVIGFVSRPSLRIARQAGPVIAKMPDRQGIEFRVRRAWADVSMLARHGD
ncbi:MAG: hypothetical protein OXI81_18235, partial [Paracoccaceae bacterium]|nr:hypothetical protein [Paracoccaceae bacterium]MDE2911334.1 hypothetical protein [Paracoccaceae bacterium]